MMFTQWLNIERDSKKNEYVEMVRNSQWFDDRWYASQYDDVYKKLIDPARHYCYTGWKENRNPCADFKTADYLRKYPECGVCPLIFEQNRNSKVDLAVCVIVKDEAPYIKEWLDYHLMLGVKRFYVYDNESSDNLRQVIMPYVRQGIVVYKYYPGEARQVPAYNECIKEYSDKVHWMAFVDADEFIVPVEKDNIPDFLADYENYPGVGINWIMFDSNGHKKRPHGGVLENYTRVQYDDNCLTNHHIKSIVKPSEVLRFINPHYCEYKDDSKYTVDVSKRYITGEGTERSFTPFVLIDKIRINHYYSKSREEADIKSIRGMATSKYGKLKLVKESEINFADYKYDYSVYKYVVKMKPTVVNAEMLKLAWLGLKNICIKIKHKFHHDLLDNYFDEDWYLLQYPDVKNSGMSAKEHYFTVGWKLGYNPSDKFDTKFYLEKYQDVARAGLNPVLHYFAFGRKEGRLPAPDFIPSPLKNEKKNAEKSFLARLNSWGNTLFSKKKSDINPLSHFITYGMNKGRLPLPNVDDILTEHNTENAEFPTDTGKVQVSEIPVEVEVKNMVDHNVSENADIISGIGDTGRQSPEDFSIPEIREDENDKAWWRRIFINRRLEGKTKEYITIYKSHLFDEKWYLKQYPEVEQSGIDSIEHYLTIGWEKGYNPSKKFNTKWYLIKYRDVREAKVNPLSHYILHGKQEGREIFPVHVSSESKLSSDSPMISVIVPIYNCEDTISETLDALIKQTYKNFEVIVVDDGSEDGSVNIVKKYVKKYPFILLHRHKHGATQGMPETIRLGIQKAKGEYIAFCESGDYWQSNCLQKRVDIINSYSDVNIVSNGVELFGNEEYRIQYKKYVDETDYLLEDGENYIDLNFIDKFNCIPTFSSVMIKKNILEKLNFASPLSKWFDFWLYRQVLAKFPLYYTHEKLVKWHMDKNFYDTLKATIDAEDSDYFIIKSNKLTGTKGFKCTNYDIVKKSKYWDEKYYLKHYKDDLDDLDAISHYICIGWKKGYNPSSGFDNNAYIKAYHDISKAHINPLIHYEICGFKEKRKVYPVNDADKK